jgi:hypothetical protein
LQLVHPQLQSVPSSCNRCSLSVAIVGWVHFV